MADRTSPGTKTMPSPVWRHAPTYTRRAARLSAAVAATGTGFVGGGRAPTLLEQALGPGHGEDPPHLLARLDDGQRPALHGHGPVPDDDRPQPGRVDER